MLLISKVPNHLGPCKPVWLNRCQITNRLDGGVTGFFKNTKKRFGIIRKSGKEFHGIITIDNKVRPA